MLLSLNLDELKTAPRSSGVYAIRHIPTGKLYVGIAQNIYKRWVEHVSGLRRKTHVNAYLQDAWDGSTPQDFSFHVLEHIEDLSQIFERENYWISFYESCIKTKGFNIKSRGRAPQLNTSKPSIPVSKEQKAVIRKAIWDEIEYGGISCMARQFNVPTWVIAQLRKQVNREKTKLGITIPGTNDKLLNDVLGIED